jgi:hypothetical protein
MHDIEFRNRYLWAEAASMPVDVREIPEKEVNRYSLEGISGEIQS